MRALRWPTASQRARKRTPIPAVTLLVLSLLLIVGAGCGSTQQTSSARTYSPGDFASRQQYGGDYAGRHASSDTQAGAAFAQWVLEQDPQHEYITDAVVRNEESLGVKVNPQITKADAQRLMTSLTEAMARTFPDKPVQVIAFYQSGDKLAQADYDPRSRQIDVRFVG
jgi:hypothetical protein